MAGKKETDSGVKFLIELGIDPKKFAADVRNALKSGAAVIRAQNNFLTAASKDAFIRAGKESAKSFYAGFNSIKPQYKIQPPTVPAARSTRTVSTPVNAPTPLPAAPPPPPAPSRTSSASASDTAYLAAVNARIEAEQRAIQVREYAAQRAKELAAQEMVANQKIAQQEQDLINKALAGIKKKEAAQAAAQQKFLQQIQARVAADTAAAQKEVAARNAAKAREFAEIARVQRATEAAQNKQLQAAIRARQGEADAAVKAAQTAEKARNKQLQAAIKAKQLQVDAAIKAAQVEIKQQEILQKAIEKRQKAEEAARKKNPFAALGGGDNGGLLSKVFNSGAQIGGLVTAIGAVTDKIQVFIEEINKAADAAIEFAQANFRLATAVRASQRLYGEQAGTIASWREEIKLIQDRYRVFSETDLTNATAQTLLLTRQFGFNEDQIKSLINATAVLAEVNGETLSEAINGATSLLQGQSRALEKEGIDASKAAFALEAVRMGLIKTTSEFDRLTLGEKALARLNFLLRQTAPLTEEAARAQGTLAGRMQTAEATIANQQKRFGEFFAKLKVGAKEFEALTVTFLVEGVGRLGELTQKAFIGTVAFIQATVEALRQGVGAEIEVIQTLAAAVGDISAGKDIGKTIEDTKAKLDEIGKSTQTFGEIFQNTYNVGVEALMGVADAGEDVSKSLEAPNEQLEKMRELLAQLGVEGFEQISDMLEDVAKQRAEAAKSFVEDYNKLTEERLQREAELLADYREKLADLERDIAQKRADAAREYGEDLAEIEEDAQQEREKVARSYSDKLEDIERDAQSKREDIARDYADKLADIERDIQQKREDATRDYNEKIADVDRERAKDAEREAEDHQRELRRIREKYAIQIDEAVQRRDARAILNLQRQRAQELREAEEDYGTKKRRADEDAADRKAAEKRDYEERLADLAREEKRRKDELEEWQKRQLADLQRSIEEKRAEALRDYERQLQDLQRSEEEKRKAALQAYQEKLADLKRAHEEARAEALRDYQNQLQDLQQNMARQEVELKNSYIKRRNDLLAYQRDVEIAIGKHWAQQYELTETGARYVANVLQQYFGLNGLADGIVSAFLQRQAGRMEIEVRTSGFGQTAPQGNQPPGVPYVPGSPYGGTQQGQNQIGMAHGGVVLANSATSVLMGEKGRELALFLPLAQAGLLGAAQKGGQRIDIDLHLNVDGRTDFFSHEFEDRVTDVIADALREAEQED